MVDTVSGQNSQDTDISYQGKRLSEWIVSFDEDGIPREQRNEASKAVQAMGAKAIPELIARIRRDPVSEQNEHNWDHFDRKWRALHAIIYLGPEAETAIPELIRCLEDRHWKIQIQVIVALAQIGKQPALVVPALEKMLDSENSEVRKYAVRSICLGFRSSEFAKAALEKALDHRDETVRQMASRGLAGENPDPGPGVRKTK